MESLRWAGARKKGESGVVVRLGFDDLAYQISLTVPNKRGFGFETRFDRDLVVTAESIQVGEGRRAFDGARVEVESTSDGRFGITMAMPSVHRPLVARELSDGTLRYLCLLTALLSPHPPPVLVLNEPETSLHPDLLLALVRPIVEATARSQVVIPTHSIPFAEALTTATRCARIALHRVDGATVARMETA